MAKFKSSKHDKKKNKGPKGKKARMKMKLDRQWGELEDPTKVRRKPALTTGASSSKSKTTTMADHEKQLSKERKWMDKQSDASEIENSDEMEKSLLSSDDEANVDGTTTTTKPLFFTKLIQSIQQQREKRPLEPTLSSQFLGQDYDDDDDDVMYHDDQEATRRPSSMWPDEIGPIHLNDEDMISVPTFKDLFVERFIQNCQPLNDSAINANASDLVSLPKIQDNPNLQIQLSNLLMEQWYFDTLSHSKTSLHQNDDSTEKEKPSEPIISKSRIHQSAQLCIQQFPNSNLVRIPESLFHHVVPSLFLPAVTSYADVCVTTDGMDFGSTNVNDDRGILDRMKSMHTVVAAHILNHVLSSRQVIQQHNQQLSKQEQSRAKTKTIKDKGRRVTETNLDDEEWKKDQGYTRPTVLVLLPTRNCCYDYVQILLSLLYGTDDSMLSPVTDFASTVDNTDRFTLEYGPPPENTKDSERTPLEQRQHRERVLRQKGALWNELFGDHRNDDDDFKIGLQINLSKKKKPVATIDTTPESFSGTVKLYSDFYRSDIILASPLGLKMTVASHDQEEDDDDDATKRPPGSTDFLSSIEICFIARADVLLQQNWDHVTDVLRLLNPLPKSMNDTDFSRVRPYFLSEQAQYWRQLILSSRHADPLITSAFKRYATGHRHQSGGIVHIQRKWDVEESSLQAVRWHGTKQVFQRVPTTASFASAGTDRVQYFMQHIWPELERQKQAHTLVFIPSYFDFVVLRNILLQRQNDGIARIDFVSVTEYSRISEVSRGRARFLQGRKEVLLYTGRAHFFLRHAIKGVRHLIFLGLPEDASFYAEHVNRLNDGLTSSTVAASQVLIDAEDPAHNTCVALFTKYDSYALERIVGSANCRRMIKSDTSTFSFTS